MYTYVHANYSLEPSFLKSQRLFLDNTKKVALGVRQRLLQCKWPIKVADNLVLSAKKADAISISHNCCLIYSHRKSGDLQEVEQEVDRR